MHPVAHARACVRMVVGLVTVLALTLSVYISKYLGVSQREEREPASVRERAHRL